jgi:hypothetical protein
VGDDVHSFDTEEKILAALGRERYINICTYQPPFDNECVTHALPLAEAPTRRRMIFAAGAVHRHVNVSTSNNACTRYAT